MLELELVNGDGIYLFSSTDLTVRIFYLNIPICVICFIGIWQFLTLRTQRVSFTVKIRRMDWLGIFVFMGATTSLLFGITVGGTVYKWTSFRTLLPLILGAVGILVFGVIEVYIPKEPMMPLKVFASRTAVSAYLGTFLHGLVCTIPNVYVNLDNMESYHLFSILVSSGSCPISPSRVDRYLATYSFRIFQLCIRRYSSCQIRKS